MTPAVAPPLLLAAVLIVTAGMLIPPVSAEIIYTDTYEDEYIITAACYVPETANYKYAQKGIIINSAAANASITSLIMQVAASDVSNYASLPQSAQAPVTLYVSDYFQSTGAIFATGTYGYFKYKVGSTDYLQAWLEFDSMNPGTISGTKYVKISPNSGSITWPGVRQFTFSTQYLGTLSQWYHTDAPGQFCAFGGIGDTNSFAVSSAHSKSYFTVSGVWKNGLTVYTEGSGDSARAIVQIQKSYPEATTTVSTHVVGYGDTVYTSSASGDAEYVVFEDFYPIRVGIYNGYNQKWYNNTFFSTPLPPEDPSAAPVTTYIQNSQTGAFITNARLSILAAAGGSVTEVINATLPSGTSTYSLEKADYLKYHASATADGYTLLSPIVFGVPENGTTIVLWMAPDAPPDVPTEPEKSMLYGYVQTQGSQQPISGATVSLDGYGSTTTSSTGFYLFNNVTPGPYTITASAPLHDALSEPVTVDPAATPHNLALKGHFLLTVSAKDADDLTTLHNTTISLSDGQESAQNPATFNVDYGPYTITAAAGGYYPQTQSAYLDKPGTTIATVLLTARPEPVPPPEMPNYPPHNVRFHCIDDFGLPLSNVSVSAAYLETTSPWSWFTDLLGIPSTVAINETTLAGTTGTDGSITFSMVEVVRYAITAHDPASNLSVNFTLYPQETQYTIQFRTRPPSDAETHPLYNLEAVPNEDNSQVSLRLAYKDRDNATTSLLFWVKDGAGEYVYTDTLEPTLLNWTNTSYTVENHPASYTWGFDATHATRDTISAARSITLHGSGRLVDLGFEDEFWYLLLSAIWIVGIGAIFSGSRVRFGAIIIPLIGGGVPTLIGWLPLATTVPIGILTFIGVFVYMRKSEYKLYR